MPAISVIVPVFNLEEEISKCLLSILLQKFTDFEIVAVDDGSDDKSAKILDEFSKKYSEIKVFHTKNNGLSAARNFGIKKASGKYVAFVDGDDYLDPEYLSKLYESIINTNSDISICGYTEYSDDNIVDFIPKERILTGKQATLELLTKQENTFIVSWNKLYRKTLFNDIIFPVHKNHEDNFTTYKLLSKAQKVSIIPFPLYNYVRRKQSITKCEKTITRLSDKLEAAKEAKNFFKEDIELLRAADFSETLAFFQFIDFSIKRNIPKSNFKKYRNKVLKKQTEFLDFKRKFYIRLLRPFNGILYIGFRKLFK